MESLVNLRAVDIARILGEQGSFKIGSYNKCIATVVPPINDIYDVIEVFYNLSNGLGNNEYTIIRKPKTKAELVKLFREFESDVSE